MGVFELVSRTDKQAVVKVNADDPLTVAMHPYVNSNMAYITLTFTYTGGHTLVSGNVDMLRRKVFEFLNLRPPFSDTILTVVKKDGSTWSISC